MSEMKYWNLNKSVTLNTNKRLKKILKTQREIVSVKVFPMSKDCIKKNINYTCEQIYIAAMEKIINAK